MDNKTSAKTISKKINLIPQELAVPARTVKAAAVLNKISIVTVIFLIITTVLVGSLIFYFSSQTRGLNTRVETLKSTVLSLSANEQKMILAKDRLSKIAVIQKEKTVDDEIGRFKEFSDIALSSSSIRLNEANITTSGTETTVAISDSTALNSFLKPLSTLPDYLRVMITSLTYNPSLGFLLNISLEN